MNELDRELTERYIYEVVRRLPRDQRGDVGLELQGLIGDMLEEGRSIEEVLTELGNPAEFAKRYQDDSHYLIGPAYYDTYRQYAKIVVICAVAVVAAFIIINTVRLKIAVIYPGNLLPIYARLIADVIAGVFGTGIAALGGVTLAFAILEHWNIKLDSRRIVGWSISDLNSVKARVWKHNRWLPARFRSVENGHTLISRTECVISIFITILLGLVLAIVPFWLSPGIAYANESGGYSNVRCDLYNEAAWSTLLPIILTALLLGLVYEIIRLSRGTYDRIVMRCSIINGALQITLGSILFLVLDFWNPDLVEMVAGIQNVVPESQFIQQLLLKFDPMAASSAVMSIIVLAALLDVGTTIYKTMRYGVDH